MFLTIATWWGLTYATGFEYIGFVEEDNAYYFYAPKALRKHFKDTDAFVVGRCIFLKKKSYFDKPEITLHELQHVKQFERLGIMFPILYMIYNHTKGYEDNPFEIEAEEAADY